MVPPADSRFRLKTLPCRLLQRRSDFDDLPANRMNPLPLLRKKIAGRYQRATADLLARRSLKLTNERPLISFTFDDFPKSALLTGGAILERYGARGTYYASFGLMDQIAPTGEIFSARDVSLLLQRGHELGCHTFAHCHACETSPEAFERSILENARALESLVPGLKLRTLSYPIGSPRPGTKRRMARYFSTCRGGGQTHNSGTVDLNRLNAFFLEQSLDAPSAIEEAIEQNARDCGWLIFATHDVSAEPTRYGCTPDFFEALVQKVREAGTEVLTVSEVYEKLAAREAARNVDRRGYRKPWFRSAHC